MPKFLEWFFTPFFPSESINTRTLNSRDLAMATTSNDALAAWKAQLAFKGKVRTSLIGDLLGLVAPSIPKREQEELQSLLAASGIHRGEQLRKFDAGKLLDMGVSEWVCKVLLEKEIIRSGISTPVAMSALAASRVDIKSSDLAIFDGGYASEELLDRLHKEFRCKPWLDLAKADM
ncbi:uncharacterized protein LOC112351209 [Selaginella moellendorffii]|uniref:uncharacterized protein LOC112351209 n=1 Tax=Selaginella moellendorffii TaxID=88036 RepID=UPI000D1CD3FF|nr:uncharacterized protein LOC112351209 [Selaginella moellendorffii]|eukprot:XP_024544419.1 uncharacterized protein LOC112351209 [Selaginella moellendorffii]